MYDLKTYIKYHIYRKLRT